MWPISNKKTPKILLILSKNQAPQPRLEAPGLLQHVMPARCNSEDSEAYFTGARGTDGRAISIIKESP